MPLYLYVCDKCTKELEVSCSVEERNERDGSPCKCGGSFRKVIGNNGGFRLGQNGSCAWSDGGYGTTHGDIENFKAGRKIY